MGKKELKKEDVIKVWKALDRNRDKKWIGLNAVCAEMGIKRYHVEQLFQGESLTEVKQRHGIRTAPQEEPYTRDRLLEKFDHIVSEHGIPTWKQIRFGGISESAIKRLFKKTDDPKRDLVKEYHEWLKKNDPHSQNLDLVEKHLKGEDKPKVSPVPTAETSRRKTRLSEKTEGRTYGPPLNYENLVYAPANEQGVVVLFAMMSKHLQYSIEGVWQDSFPDCEATRLERGGSRRRVKIEFEYRSKDFENHCHDPNGCDVLVCWKDNWKDRPATIEVIELSKEIEKMLSTKK